MARTLILTFCFALLVQIQVCKAPVCFFGLSFLPPDEVTGGFVQLTTLAPITDMRFVDYILDNYVPERRKFSSEVLGSRPHSWSLQQSEELEEEFAEEQDVICHKPGYTCDSNCSTVYLCAGEAPGIPVEIQKCDVDFGQYCSVALQKCSYTATSCNPRGFECTGPGDFPDPFDCTVFHSCTANAQAQYVDHVAQCEEGWAYNAGTDSCSSRMNDSVCVQGPVPPCYKIGETGVVPENPRMYFICVQTGGILHPQLYRCSHGFYDPATYQCVAEQPMTTTTTVEPPTGYICRAPGIFVDPEDCHHYYVCDQYLNPHRWSCYLFTRFDQKQMRCVMGLTCP